MFVTNKMEAKVIRYTRPESFDNLLFLVDSAVCTIRFWILYANFGCLSTSNHIFTHTDAYHLYFTSLLVIITQNNDSKTHAIKWKKCENLIIRSYIIYDHAPTNDNKNHAIARNKCRKNDNNNILHLYLWSYQPRDSKNHAIERNKCKKLIIIPS